MAPLGSALEQQMGRARARTGDGGRQQHAQAGASCIVAGRRPVSNVCAAHCASNNHNGSSPDMRACSYTTMAALCRCSASQRTTPQLRSGAGPCTCRLLAAQAALLLDGTAQRASDASRARGARCRLVQSAAAAATPPAASRRQQGGRRPLGSLSDPALDSLCIASVMTQT